MTERPRVAVVGGGLAGLQAALACADAGAAVTLLEARRRLGGATYSFARGGLTIDNGQHVFLRCCTAYRGLLRRLGTSRHTVLQDRLELPVLRPGGAASGLRRGRLPAPLHLAGALARYRPVPVAERLAVARAALALRRLDPGAEALDGQAFGAWLAAHRQSGAAIAAMWDLIALPALNLPAAEASLAGAVKVFRTGLLDANDGADLGLPRVPLAELHGEPAERALRVAGAAVHLGVRARRVEAAGNGQLEVVCDTERAAADAVILAVPHHEVGSLLPPGSVRGQDQLGRLGSSAIVNVHVLYDRRVTALGFAAAVDSPVQWVFDRTGPSGLGEGQYLALSLSAARQWIDQPTAELRRRFLPALVALFPAAATAQVREVFVTRERHATFAAVPGTARLRPGPKTALPGLYLAGAWTDTGWPATMEGAVRSGLAAATHALGQVGRGRWRAEAAA